MLRTKKHTLDDLIEHAKSVPDCKCDRCVRNCNERPGWFAPGEVENLAEFLGLSVEETFDKYLVLDYYLGLNQTKYVFVPWKHPPELSEDEKKRYTEIISQHEQPGTEVRFSWPFKYGKCVFLKDGLCSIHPVKPLVCRMANHDEKLDYPISSGAINKIIADAWQENGTELHRIQ